MSGPTPSTSVDPRPVVVSWVADHGRSRGLALLVGGDCVFMPWARAGAPRWRTAVGYLRSVVRTVRAVRDSRGRLVIVMVPPIFSVLATMVVARWTGSPVAVDVHSGALNDRRWRWSRPLLQWLLRRAGLVIVTTRRLLEGIDLPADRVLVLHDPPLPRLSGQPEVGSASASAARYVVFPASGSWDEPLDAVADAARLLDDDGIRVVVTGRIEPRDDAVMRTGFLDRSAYDGVLANAAAILALTTREATMQRAAYEAVDMGRPLVCSDTGALREAFGEAAVYTAADGPAIREAVLAAIERSSALVEQGNLVSAGFVSQAAAARDVLLALDRAGGRCPARNGPAGG